MFVDMLVFVAVCLTGIDRRREEGREGGKQIWWVEVKQIVVSADLLETPEKSLVGVIKSMLWACGIPHSRNMMSFIVCPGFIKTALKVASKLQHPNLASWGNCEASKTYNVGVLAFDS